MSGSSGPHSAARRRHRQTHHPRNVRNDCGRSRRRGCSSRRHDDDRPADQRETGRLRRAVLPPPTEHHSPGGPARAAKALVLRGDDGGRRGRRHHGGRRRHADGHGDPGRRADGRAGEGIQTPSSFFLMIIPDFQGQKQKPFIYADCAVNIAPTAEYGRHRDRLGKERPADSGEEPRVALLSFSTKGSASHVRGPCQRGPGAGQAAGGRPEDRRRVPGRSAADSLGGRQEGKGAKASWRASQRADLSRPELGQYRLQADPVHGRAQAIGPFLQGFAKPISDLSRGATVEDIVATAICPWLRWRRMRVRVRRTTGIFVEGQAGDDESAGGELRQFIHQVPALRDAGGEFVSKGLVERIGERHVEPDALARTISPCEQGARPWTSTTAMSADSSRRWSGTSMGSARPVGDRSGRASGRPRRRGVHRFGADHAPGHRVDREVLRTWRRCTIRPISRASVAGRQAARRCRRSPASTPRFTRPSRKWRTSTPALRAVREVRHSPLRLSRHEHRYVARRAAALLAGASTRSTASRPSRQRLFDDGGPERALGRHLHGSDAAGRTGDGDAHRRLRSGHPVLPGRPGLHGVAQQALQQAVGLLGISGCRTTCGICSSWPARAATGDAGNRRVLLPHQVHRHVYGRARPLDAIVFTGGIGENATELREKICLGMTPARRAIRSPRRTGSGRLRGPRSAQKASASPRVRYPDERAARHRQRHVRVRGPRTSGGRGK